MKRILLIGLLLVWVLPMQAADRAAQWKQVEEAARNGLPQTAIGVLDGVIEGALKDKDYPEATKAIGLKLSYEGQVQGNKPEEKIRRLTAEIAKAPAEMKPLLHTVQALWYWEYFQMNRWRFHQRTQTATEPGEDFTTWDLKRIFAEIHEQFGLALSNPVALQKIPVTAWDELLEKGDLPDSYRPTLYDFIAAEALVFYASGEQAGVAIEGAFELDAQSPVLGSLEEFLAWSPVTTDTNAPAYLAVKLYQSVLRFHQKDAEPSALLDFDIARLVFAKNLAKGESKLERFKNVMRQLAEKWADQPLSAFARYHWAEVLRGEDKEAEAHAVAKQGRDAHKDSPGGKACHNLILQIEAKDLRIFTERVWNNPLSDIEIRYRNLTNVHFRIYADKWEPPNEEAMRRRMYHTHEVLARLLAEQPVKSWSQALPPTTDYRQRLELAKAPTGLPPGLYQIVASEQADFSTNQNQLSVAQVWVSDLALVSRGRADVLEGVMTHAESGEPLADGNITLWLFANQPNRWVSHSTVKTDAEGRYRIDFKNLQSSYILQARHGGQELTTENLYWWHNPSQPEARESITFFTDRALYRPGQTVHFKGVWIRADQRTDKYELVTGRSAKVELHDPNGERVAELTLPVNDFGSFAGSFVTPRGRVNGNWRLVVPEANGANMYFNVEEYKRPKFQVTMTAPKTAVRLNETVRVEGSALAYTGAAIDNATVSWRVVRNVSFPSWWGFWGRGWNWSQPVEQEIAHGTAQTTAGGNFSVEFPALPDRSVAETNEPIFSFSVYVDVTDGAGETRSAQQVVRVGYTALQAEVTIADWQTTIEPIAVKITTQTHDSEPQAATGIVKVYRLREPEKVQRTSVGEISHYRRGAAGLDYDPSDPNQWPLGEVVATANFSTPATGSTTNTFQLGVGWYRVTVETQDRFGRKVTAFAPLCVLDPAAEKLISKMPFILAAPKWSVEPGEEFQALWGTGYDTGRALVEIEHRGKILTNYWTEPGRTQQLIRQPVTEAMRGGFTLHVTQVRENRAYTQSLHVDVPWTNREFELSWEHFTSKLEPGQKDTWKVVIKPKGTNSSAERIAAEMVATLYDASLDQFAEHGWLRWFNVFRNDYTTAQARFSNGGQWLNTVLNNWQDTYLSVPSQYRHLPWGFHPYRYATTWRFFGRTELASRGGEDFFADNLAALGTAVEAKQKLGVMNSTPIPASAGVPATASFGAVMDSSALMEERLDGKVASVNRPPDLNLSQVTARKNLNETAFFLPQLTSDSNGVVRVTFTMPEALTEWKFMGFAHDRQLRSGYLEGKTVTAKDLMVQPNPPRFVREGDVLEFSVKVSNQSAAQQTGKVRLNFNDARTGESADKALGNTKNEFEFSVPAKESRTFAWRINVPDGQGFLTYKAVGSTGKLSDGEEGFLPVLSRRVLVTESLPLPIRGPATEKFTFDALKKSGKSRTLQHQNLVVQMVSNPSWYAVLALPYLMEYPHECTEQTFNRYYANLLAQHIANSDPKIAKVFEQWRNTPALDSPLEKNEDLKSVLLEETPWLRDAKNESAARRNVAVLFDANRLNIETMANLQKLAEMQNDDGFWPWFPGGQGNEYITLYITTGFGRLHHLGVDVPLDAAVLSLEGLDAWMQRSYEEIQRRPSPENYVITSTDALYLYGRSFYLKDHPVSAERQKALDFFLRQGRKHWLQVGERQSQGHLALGLHRFAVQTSQTDPTPTAIMRSLKERSVSDKEMGRFWRDTEYSWWWYRAPIESQAVMIEAFDEIMADAATVEDCKTWLLKQKQTQDWKTTKATADAVYALLLRGTDILASDKLVEIKLGGATVTPTSARDVEAGTGFFEKRFAPADIKPKLGDITLKKVDSGVAWGSVHWQYLEDVSAVKPHTGTPLKLKKSVFKKVNTSRGPELQSVKDALGVGDELVMRVELRVDRDMEYVHLKDQRGSGTEPVNVLSQYHYQDGLAYYESTRDTASHFFIDYLPKGTYVFEYSVRVQHRGEYQTGLAEIQCMYAPEFNSHSESVKLIVK